MAQAQHWCCEERSQESCYELHVAAPLGPRKGKRGSYTYRCPVPGHADHRQSLSVNSGSDGMWLVWYCQAGCDKAAVRDALSGLGIDDDCLGKYANGSSPAAKIPPHPAYKNDPSIAADARRWRAVRSLPANLNGTLLKDMCIQALTEGDGTLAGDPHVLLPVERDDFIALAWRTQLDRAYAYRLYRKWMSYEGA